MAHSTVNPVVFGFIVPGTCLIVASLIARKFPFDQALASPTRGGRFGSLDGLRGFLALGVFLSHCLYTRTFVATGQWATESRFFDGVAKLSVVLFFMITGFLFWSKAIRAHGRIDLVRHFRGRLLRVGPMYLVSAAVVFLMAVAATGAPGRMPPRGLVKLFSLGAFEWVDLNGFDPDRVNAGVAWTLRFEWRFYALLPVMAALFWGPKRFIAAVLALGLYRWFTGSDRAVDLSVVFACGMAAAQWTTGVGRVPALRGHAVAVVCVLGLAAMLAFGPTAYHPVAYLPLAAVFFCLVQGNTLFGVLERPAVRHLGTISYSLYLVHGIVLFLAGRVVLRLLGTTTMSTPVFWAFALVCGAATVVVASVTYRFVEHPFMRIEAALGAAHRTKHEPEAGPAQDVNSWPDGLIGVERKATILKGP